MTTTTTVRTVTLALPGGQVCRVSLFAHEDGRTLVLSRGWNDGPDAAGLDADSTLTLPGVSLSDLRDALAELEGSG